MRHKRTLFIFTALVALALLSLGGIWLHQSITAGTELSIQEALERGRIAVDLNGTGTYSGEGVINGRISNRTGRQLVIRIPAGTELIPKDRSKQKILLPLEEQVVLKPFETREVELAGFCMNQELGTPTDDTRFEIGRVVGGELGVYVNSINASKIRYAPAEVQLQVWEITGGEDNRQPLPSDPSEQGIEVYILPETQSGSELIMPFEGGDDGGP